MNEAIEIFEMRLHEVVTPVPRRADILLCLHCESKWSLVMDSVVSPTHVTMTAVPVPLNRIKELGAGVSWYGLDDCKLCEKDRKAPNWDELLSSIEKLPDAWLRGELTQMLEDRRRRFR